MALVLILLGAPGAGKGTQAVRLGEALALPHVSTGDLFRTHLAQGTPLGRRAREFMDAGRLVPDELVLEMLFERVARPDCAAGYVLDGFPRTLPQARALAARLAADDELRVAELEVPDAVLVRRLTGRRTCKQCGNIQHIEFSPPREAGRCDRCKGELVQRSDDTAAVVEERLAVYRAQTRPLVEHYAGQGVLTRVDGNRPPAEVFQAVQRWATRGEAA